MKPSHVAKRRAYVQMTGMESGSDQSVDQVLALRPPLTDLVNRRRFQEALALCEKERSGFPRDPWLATMQAFVHLRLRQHAKAAEVSAEAIGLGSEDPLALYVLGVSQRRLGRHAEAAAALLQTHRRLPNHVDAACMLLDEAVAAHGIDAARPIYAEVSSRLSDPRVKAGWARLLFHAGLDRELPPGCVSAPLLSVADWLARAGEPLSYLGPRETIPVAEPVVVGDPEPSQARPVRVPGYVPYVCTLRDATVFARSNVVLMPDGVAVNDTLADPRYGRFVTFASEPVVLDRREDQLLLDVGRFKPAQYDAAVMLSGSVSEHFGHWVPEYLCRLHYLVRHPRFADLPIIVDSGMPASHVDYLRRIVPNKLVFLAADVAVRCRELIVASPSTFFPVHLAPDHTIPPHMQGGVSVDCIRFVRDRVLEGAPPPGPGGRKVYLARKKRSFRRLANEDEVATYLEHRGFEIAFPEDLTFDEQVKLFQSAEIIVAPNGSSILNVIFAPQTAKIFALSQRSVFNWGTYCGFVRELGYDLKFICGDSGNQHKHADYTVPLDRIDAALAPFLD